MTKDLITIDPKEFGLDEKQGNEVIEAFREPFAELASLEPEFDNFRNLAGEPSEETCAAAKELKQRYVKVRTKTAAIHKEQKAFFLNAGRCVDAFKNRQLEIGKEREDILTSTADFYIIREQERIQKLQTERGEEIAKYQDPESCYIPPDLGAMPEELWLGYLTGVKSTFEKKQAEIREAQEKEEEERRKQEAENRRIREENEKLRLENEAKEKELQKEREKLEKQKAKEKAEAETHKAEAARLAAAPDIEKLKAYIQELRSVPCPAFQDNSDCFYILDTFKKNMKESIIRLECSIDRLNNG